MAYKQFDIVRRVKNTANGIYEVGKLYVVRIARDFSIEVYGISGFGEYFEKVETTPAIEARKGDKVICYQIKGKYITNPTLGEVYKVMNVHKGSKSIVLKWGTDEIFFDVNDFKVVKKAPRKIDVQKLYREN